MGFPKDFTKELGIRAYRFSISWPRVLPDGVGPANEKGMEFYSQLVDALLDAHIEPWITLFHWDYPLALLRRRRAWRARAGWFSRLLDRYPVTAVRLRQCGHGSRRPEPAEIVGCRRPGWRVVARERAPQVRHRPRRP